MKDFTHIDVLTYVLAKIKEFAAFSCRIAENMGIIVVNLSESSGWLEVLANHWKWNMFIYGLKNCDIVRKARKALPEATMHDVRDSPLSREKLAGFLQAFPDTLLNKRSTAWRKLSEAERAGDPIALLQAHPALMKRPLIEVGAQLYLGWTPENEAALKAA